MTQPDFPVGSVVRAFRKGEIDYVGEFLSCDGVFMTLRTMGPQGVPWRDSFSIKGYVFECWEDLKGMEGIAFLRMMDEDDDWCERSFFQKFEPRQLEILFLDGDVRIRDDAAERISEERLVELILEQDNFEAAQAALDRIKSEKYLRHLAAQTEDRWELEDEEATALRSKAMKRFKPREAKPEPEPLTFPPAPPRKKGGLPSTYVEKQERLKAEKREAKNAAEKARQAKPWWWPF